MTRTPITQIALLVLIILQTCLCMVNADSNENNLSQSPFTWKPKAWRGCITVNSCEEPGIRRRSLVCVNSRGETIPHRKCDRKNRPRRKELCVADECRNQTVFAFKVFPWKICKPEQLSNFDIQHLLNKKSIAKARNMNDSLNGFVNFMQKSNWKTSVIDSCGSVDNTLIYIRKRNVSCFAHWSKKKIDVETTLEDCIKRSSKNPRTAQVCSFACKQQCSVGIWSKWQNSTISQKTYTFRVRKIAYFPYSSYSLKICPNLFENEKNGERSKGLKKSIQLEISAWSLCKKLNSSRKSIDFHSTAIGIQTRTVRCVNSKGMRIECNRKMSDGIPKSRACLLARNCRVSDWGTWSNCYPVLSTRKFKDSFMIYERHRKRNITLNWLPPGKMCPPIREKQLCKPVLLSRYVHGDQNVTSTNETFEWFVGRFGRCKPDKKDCRSGIKARSVFCIRRGDAEFNPVGSQFCAHMKKPMNEVFCRNPCQETCVLGEWIAWSGCMADCNSNVRGIVRGTYYRVRRVIQYSGDPKSCEDYAESRPCTLRNCVQWVAGTQTICLLDNIHRACGNGKTHRAVYCMNAKGRQVNESLCQENMPSRSFPCHVPCSHDCVVGTWSGWGPCEGDCGRNGTQGESYRIRKRNILAHPGWSGRPCPNTDEMVQRKSCFGENCGTYHWKVGIWGKCQIDQQRFRTRIFRDAQNRICRIGKISRSVNCVNNTGDVVRRSLCSSFMKPQENKECSLCAEDCILSPWSEWTTCPLRCKMHRNEEDIFRERWRYIIREGRDGGKLCPKIGSLTQSSICQSCDEYHWRWTSWSDCYTPPNGNCNGLKKRNVLCVRRADLHVESDECCRPLGRKPAEAIGCTKNCDKRCVLTGWSRWGQCSKVCGNGYSRRTRDTVGNRFDCDNRTVLSEERRCNTHPCGQYSLRSGAWSQCYPKDPKRGCGAGLQWRNVTCFKLSGSEVPLQYCIDELYAGKITLSFQRRCVVSCPLDCKLSSWTAFTSCSRKCGSGIKTRLRTIVQQATHGGKMCASDGGKRHITEIIPCIERECYNFVWKEEPWGACKITNQTRGRVTKCGTGFHTRKVYCIDKRYSGPRSRLNDSYCDEEEKPAMKDTCTMYCPGDCVVGEWTSWSKCSSACPIPGNRRRERTVLRYPAHDGQNCPVLEEYQACNMKHCYTHNWRTTPWSSCRFYRDDTSCGIGTQRRMADCVRRDGKITHPVMCRVEGRRVPTLLRMCNVPCPRNCELSGWGSWSICQDKCNTASVQRRTRFVLARAEHGGQSCLESDSLQEYRSCPMNPCFKVKIGDWGECLPSVEGSCGYGLEKRTVDCIRDDGQIVDDSKCLQLASGFNPEERPCKIACNGDCLVTQWSPWSSCFGACTVNNESMFEFGTRLRTRHVLREPDEFGEKCPKDLTQKEQCSKPMCFTFSWKTGPYVQKKRDVWCERSDGLRVSNGCHLAYKPSSTQSCVPACKVAHSFCNSKTICVCKKDYIPIIGSHGHLLHCLSDSTTYRNGTDNNDITTGKSSNGQRDSSWFGDLPIIIWVVIGVCFVYFLLFLAIVIVYTRRRKSGGRERRADTADVGTLTNPERIPLTEQKPRHQRSESKASFATSSGRGSTLSTISDRDDGEQWPEPPDNVVSEFIRQHLQNFNTGSFCSTFSDESLGEHSKTLGSPRAGTSFDAGTL